MTGRWDAIVLDVDNGPDFLIHPHNGALRRAPHRDGVRPAGLTPGGSVAIWCQAGRRYVPLEPASRRRREYAGSTLPGPAPRFEYVIYTLRQGQSAPELRQECAHDKGS